MEFAWLPVHNNIVLSHKNVWSIKTWEPSKRSPSMACRFLWERHPKWWGAHTFVTWLCEVLRNFSAKWNFWPFSGDSETELLFPVWRCHPPPLQYSWTGTCVCNAISQSQGPSSDQREELSSVGLGISASQDHLSMVHDPSSQDIEKNGGNGWRASGMCTALDELTNHQIWGTGKVAMADTSWKNPGLVRFDVKRNSVPIKGHITLSYFLQNDMSGSHPNKPVITIFQRKGKLCGLSELVPWQTASSLTVQDMLMKSWSHTFLLCSVWKCFWSFRRYLFNFVFSLCGT